MTASRPTATTDDEQFTSVPWEEFSDQLLRYAWQPALRFVLDRDHAAGRCRRRGCKLAGQCRMTVRDDEPLDCGGGVSDETLAAASRHVLFGCAMVRRFCEDFDLAPARLAVDDGESEALPPVSRRRKRG